MSKVFRAVIVTFVALLAGAAVAYASVVLSVGSQEQQPEQSIGLSVMIDRCARERAEAYFGPEVNAEQIERVTRCEWDIFTYHAATGDDADCWCGAHGSSATVKEQA